MPVDRTNKNVVSSDAGREKVPSKQFYGKGVSSIHEKKEHKPKVVRSWDKIPNYLRYPPLVVQHIALHDDGFDIALEYMSVPSERPHTT
jgi:hypothetical protein